MRTFYLLPYQFRFGFIIGMLTLFASFAFGQNQNEIQLNQFLQRSIKGGETHSFQFNVKEGFYARVEVAQKDIDVVVSLFDADGKLLVEMDGKNGFLWREAVSCVAEKDGNFRVAVRSHGAPESGGSYTINLAERRPAQANDRQRLKAERHLSAGRKLSDQGNASPKAIIDEYESAKKLWRELKESEYEAITLFNLGWTYYMMSEYQQAIAALSQAAELFRETRDRFGESKATNILGATYYYLGQLEKAQSYYEQTLIIKREIKDRRGEIVTLVGLGDVSRKFGKYDKAQNYLEQALTISREIKNRLSEASALNSLAVIYDDLGQYAKAAQYYEQILPITREFKSRFNENVVLNNLGILYAHLNQYEKARDYYEQSLAIARELKDRNSEGIALYNLGNTYYTGLKQYEKARLYYEQALTIKREIRERSDQANVLNGLGNVYTALGQYDKAFEYYEQGLKIRRELKDQSAEVASLNSLGILFEKRRQYEKARDYYEQALKVAKEIKTKQDEADVAGNLLRFWHNLKQPQYAIFYGKQAVNAYQEIRSNIKSLDKDLQKSFFQPVEETYRRLADILISEGRLLEAQAVLDLLKDEEFEPVSVYRNGQNPDIIPYSKAETDVIAKVENLAALGREKNQLQTEMEESGESFPAEKQKRLDKILTDIEVASKAFRESLGALGKSEKSVQTKVEEIESEKSLQRTLKRLSRELNTNVVALYTVIGTEESKNDRSEQQQNTDATNEQTRLNKPKFGWVILVTPESRKAYPIDVTDLNEIVMAFRAALSSDKYDPKPIAAKLYDKIFRQVSAKQKTSLEADLNTYLGKDRNKTIMWSLDSVLRYVPMAALHDGKQYLVEKYQQVVFNKQSLSHLDNAAQTQWKVLGLGVTEAKTIGNQYFEALNGTRRELQDIVREPNEKTGVLDGIRKLDGDFTKEAVLRLWREGKYPVVHIASHFSFNPVDHAASFLLIGDGKLTFADIQDKDNLFGAVDLLTLSACDTAMSSNGKESESFAYLAQSLGAESVIASLWKISDAGTPELMIRFYKMRAENSLMPKGEAFRQAQLQLLYGSDAAQNDKSFVTKSSRAETTNATRTSLPVFKKDERNPFAHPHYWASFVLTGNWR